MKTLSQKINEQKVNEAKMKLDLQDDTVGWIEAADLKKYLTVADKFISADAKEVIQWAIENNPKDNGIDTKGNWLANFYEKGVPKNPELKKLYAAVGKLVKANRQLELPFFQTDEQFQAIINKKTAPDEIILDLESEEGRNAVAQKYDKLIWKIAQSFVGKSNLSLDELYSSGAEGLTYAMNRYGKRTEKTQADDEKLAGFTFLSFAAYNIRNMILHDIKNVSHIVRIPVSAQQKEKKETGKNTKSNTVSGDQTVGKGDSQKTMFDFMAANGSFDAAAKDAITTDVDKIWKEIYDELEKKFGGQQKGSKGKNIDIMDIWYSFNNLNGREKVKNKDLAEKYGILPSNINYYCNLVNTYMLKTPKIRELLNEIRELTFESRQIHDEENKMYESTFKLSR